MDKIFKNDKIMGIVAVLTFAMVGYLVYLNSKQNKAQPASQETDVEGEA